MLWKDFKNIVELQGIRDDTEITYIDTNMFKPKVTRNIDSYGKNITYIG